jgi:MFS family permease
VESFLFASLLSRLKDEARHASQVAALTMALALAVVAAAGFLLAALFVAASERYGTLNACFILAGVFLVLALLIGVVLFVLRRAKDQRDRMRAQAQANLQFLKDPVVMATLLQVVRSAGARRLLPLAAIAFGAFFLATSARRPKRDGAGKTAPGN